jgi:hypothetical protein
MVFNQMGSKMLMFAGQKEAIAKYGVGDGSGGVRVDPALENLHRSISGLALDAAFELLTRGATYESDRGGLVHLPHNYFKVGQSTL